MTALAGDDRSRAPISGEVRDRSVEGRPTTRAWQRGAAIVVAAAVAVGGFGMPALVEDPYLERVMVDGATTGLAALGVGFLIRQTGLLSFGHALFFGGSAYAFGIAALRWNVGGTAAVAGAMAVAVLLGLVSGALAVRLSGLGFAMLTLAFSQTAYVWVASNFRLTGGIDGLRLPYSVKVFGRAASDYASTETIWPWLWATLVVTLVLLAALTRSSFGRTLSLIRENTVRAEFLGRRTYWPRVLAFTFSAVIAAVAGLFHALHQGFVAHDSLLWTKSGEFVIQSLLGGAHALLGPPVGAFSYALLQNELADRFDHWAFVVGLVLIAVVVWAPRGIVGLFESLRPHLVTAARRARGRR